MGRSTWSKIKVKKNFNVNIYRTGLSVLISSLLLSTILLIFIIYIYLHEPERAFYATSGITPPVQLRAMTAKNMSSQPLLASDPIVVERQRDIPQ